MAEAYTTAFETHSRYRNDEEDVFSLDGVDFEAWVRVGSEAVVLVSVLPTLDATVTGETVATVVEEGWFETFERRVADAPTVATGTAETPTVTREGPSVRIETPIMSEPDRAPSDALAVATFIEGTWVQGVIPGYEYDERVRSILDRAQEHASGG